ncbi:acyltransferase [Lysobacter niabensis]|uniref:acyltransferase n=1 Tax=Agrilutibacter niabensis TaxID=380628 RepID=UPI00361AEFAE
MIRKIIYKIFGGVRYARHIGVAVGDDCRIFTDLFGSEPWLISIGDRVTISSEVTFINHDGVGWLFSDEQGRRFKYAKIVIGNDVFIGANSIILPGVSIGSNCVVGAGSVVTRSMSDNTVAAGNPARVLGGYDQMMEKVMKWRSESEMHGGDRMKRVNSILDHGHAPFMLPRK